VDRHKSVGLPGAPSPGSVPSSLFHGERGSDEFQLVDERKDRNSRKKWSDDYASQDTWNDKHDRKKTRDNQSLKKTGRDNVEKIANREREDDRNREDEPEKKKETWHCEREDDRNRRERWEDDLVEKNHNKKSKKKKNHGSAREAPRYGVRTHNLFSKRETSEKNTKLVKRWETVKNELYTTSLAKKQKYLINQLATIGTELLKTNNGSIGDVAKGIGGTLVSPPLNVSDVKHYFGVVKKFPMISELLHIIEKGVPVKTSQSKYDLEKALKYGNHRSIQEHLPRVWKKIIEDVKRNRCLVFHKAAATDVDGLQVAPLGAVVTNKVRLIHDHSFETDTFRGNKGGINKDTLIEDVPKCLCGEALPKLLAELTGLRVKFPSKRILLSKADVSDAFRNVRVDAEQAKKFCYVLDELLVADFRLTFGWAGSPGNWGVLSSAAEHSHCHTSIEDAVILPEGADMMSHVKVVEPWEVGKPATVPKDARVRPSSGGEVKDPFFAIVYVDDFILAKVQHEPADQSALVASASLASDHVRLFGPGEKGHTPILAPKKSTHWDTIVDALGYTINTHSMTIAITRDKVAAIRELLVNEWPADRYQASAQDVLSIAGKLWNLTFVVRAGRYFVWQLLRLTGLHTSETKQRRTKTLVDLGWEFHGDIAFWKWAIEHRLVESGESLNAPFYAHIQRPPVRRYLSDASFEAVGGYCPELKIFWRYTLDVKLTAELKRKARARETSSITINLLELFGMFMTAWVVQCLVGDRPNEKGAPILMRGDNVSAVSWVNRCGGSRDRRAGLLMRLLGRLEIESGWCHIAKHIPGVANTLADGISRWPEEQIKMNICKLTNDENWRQQDLGDRGKEIFEKVLQAQLPTHRLDDEMWSIMTRARD